VQPSFPFLFLFQKIFFFLLSLLLPFLLSLARFFFLFPDIFAGFSPFPAGSKQFFFLSLVVRQGGPPFWSVFFFPSRFRTQSVLYSHLSLRSMMIRPMILPSPPFPGTTLRIWTAPLFFLHRRPFSFVVVFSPLMMTFFHWIAVVLNPLPVEKVLSLSGRTQTIFLHVQFVTSVVVFSFRGVSFFLGESPQRIEFFPLEV